MLERTSQSLFIAALWCTGCQLVVDFPEERDTAPVQSGDDRGDAEAKRDAEIDAEAESDGGVSLDAAGAANEAGSVGEASAEAAVPMEDASAPSSCATTTHAGCAADELCCEELGVPSCRKSTTNGCAACGQGCSDALAPHCGARACECEAGSQRACAAGQRCEGGPGVARCVECATDADCRESPGGSQCVSGKCVECDRGALAEDAADDQGCSRAVPICNAEHHCVACTREPDNCPGELLCNGELGCHPCDAMRPVGVNGCAAATPVCRLSADGVLCTGCLVNADCGAGGFCDTATGTCTNVCDPDGLLGDNGCTGATPFCAASGAGYACRGCVASDCAGATPLCAVTGARAGSCVGCRDALDCLASPLAPVCDAMTALCRSRVAADCAAPTPILVEGGCVACTSDVQCAGTPGRPYCDPVSHACVACTELPNDGCITRSAAAPFCNATSGACEQCLRNTHCSAVLTPRRTPICLNASCVACNDPGVANPATACTADLGGLACLMSGPEAGRCGTITTP